MAADMVARLGGSRNADRRIMNRNASAIGTSECAAGAARADSQPAPCA
jgi:hypothetical protein